MKYNLILSEEQLEILDVALIGAKFYYENQIIFDTKYYAQLLKEISELQNEVEKAGVYNNCCVGGCGNKADLMAINYEK